MVRVGGYYFIRRGIRLYSFPPESALNLDRGLVRRLKIRSLLTSVLMEAPRKDMYEFVHSSGNYSLDQFNEETRWAIRTSLNNCEFRRPSLSDLIKQGRKINRATQKKQYRSEQILNTRRQWKRAMKSVYFHPGFNILGAFYEDRMVGHLITYKVGGIHHILKGNTDSRYTGEAQPMSGLLYTRITELMDEYGKITISYGMHRSRGKSTQNDFMRGMLFSPVPYTRGFILNPLVSLLLKFLVWYLIRVQKNSSVSSRWAREVISIYQGYRAVNRLFQDNERKRKKESAKSKVLRTAVQSAEASA